MPLLNINEALAALDSARRGVGNRFGEVLDNPMAYLNRSLSRYAEENLPSRADMQDARSVMPWMADAAGEKLFNLASGGMGGVGRVAGHTVRNPQRLAYPDILGNPRALVAAPRIADEDPLLQRLWNVDRDDLWEISGHGRRQGNEPGIPFRTAANPQGNAAAQDVMTERNALRLLDFIAESERRPELHRPMASWYVMDPVYRRMEELFGKKEAVERYKRFNSLTGMASPGSAVMDELNRGTGAHWLAEQGRFQDFVDFGGIKKSRRAGYRHPETGEPFPADMRFIKPHPYHKTSQAGPMQRYLEAGEMDMDSAKVPSYVLASGVPETGFQTQWPVGDAHWSRLVGLPDVRTAATKSGREASATVPEMYSLSPWWRDMVAGQAGLEAVPAQAIVWGAGSRATGVKSPLGAGKLELLSMQIGKASERLGVSP